MKLTKAFKLAGLATCLAGLQGIAQTYTIVHDFGTNVMGMWPSAALLQGPDGSLYGTTEKGGSANLGQIFSLNPDGSGYTALKDFAGSDGADPRAGLVLSGTTLYGTASSGGLSNCGVLFRMESDGSGYTVLRHFTGTRAGSNDGGQPLGKLVIDGTTLYGTTAIGGAYGYGTVFKVNTDGSGFVLLRSFNWPDGILPSAGVALNGTTLYGTTCGAGATIYKLNTDGGGFAVLGSLSGNIYSELVLSGNTLYGTAYSGSEGHGYGFVFKLNTDGTGFTRLKDFQGRSDGAGPQAGLVLQSSVLFGTTAGSSSLDFGTVFRLNVDGTGYSVLKTFNDPRCYTGPAAALFLSGTTLYGTTYQGGAYGQGSVFKINFDGSGYTGLTNFAGSDGTAPNATLLAWGTNLFGVTQQGGSAGRGTVFKCNWDGSGYTVLHSFPMSSSFQDTEGNSPCGVLAAWGTNLYGAAYSGGGCGFGTIFKLGMDGSGFEVLKHFSGPDGQYPQGGLVLSGTTLYGTTSAGGTLSCTCGSGCGTGYGTVFRINIDGTGFAVIKYFSGADGGWPGSELLLSGTTLYGTAYIGGAFNVGGVFKMNMDGTGYTLLKEFTGSDGGRPVGGLVLSGSTLYGTTFDGRTTNQGLVFRVNTDGSQFAIIHDFPPTSYDSGSQTFTNTEGAVPQATLVLAGTKLLGTTSRGGAWGYGTIFALDTGSSAYSLLATFAYTNRDPIFHTFWTVPGLALGGTSLFGTTPGGGRLDNGTLFSLSLAPPTIQALPSSQTVESGATVRLLGTAAGTFCPVYEWFFNETNLLCAGTNSCLGLPNIQLAQAGKYTVAVTDIFGSATSAPAMLSVIVPVERRIVPSLTLRGATGSTLHLDHTSELAPEGNWLLLDTVILTNPPQYYFDLTANDRQRFYRAWQTTGLEPAPVLDVHRVPAITLTGAIGSSVRLDYINQFGPVDAWVTNLATVTLTNTSQLYFDISSIGQPPRLWRIVPVP